MKAIGAVALLLLAALAAVPTAQAQAQAPTLVCPDLATPIPYQGSATLTCDLTADCVGFLTGMGDMSGSVSVVSPPSWLTATAGEATFDPQDCVANGGSATSPVEIPVSVSAAAPGVVEHTLNLEATAAGGTATDTVVVTVAYNVNYTLVPDVAFPLAVTGDQVVFNVTVTQASNARSMVMMEELSVSTGFLSGPVSQVYESEAGKPATETFKFTYKPPEGDWTNATATFVARGHYLLTDGRAGNLGASCGAETRPTCDSAGTIMTFTFTNAQEHEHKESKDSPAPVAPLLLLGLVALAVAVRRRA